MKAEKIQHQSWFLKNHNISKQKETVTKSYIMVKNGSHSILEHKQDSNT